MPNKRKSNRELAITGSQLNEDEQILEPGEPDMPGDLGPCEKIVWTETVALLSEANRLTRLDALSLHAYSRSVCQWREAYAALKISGSIQRAGTGAEKMSAQLQVFNTADRTLERWTAQLGMSPKSRPSAVVQPAAGGDELDRLLHPTPETDAAGNTYELVDE